MGKTLATKFSKPQASFIFSFSELEQIAVTKRLLCPLFIVVIFFFLQCFALYFLHCVCLCLGHNHFKAR